MLFPFYNWLDIVLFLLGYYDSQRTVWNYNVYRLFIIYIYTRFFVIKATNICCAEIVFV